MKITGFVLSLLLTLFFISSPLYAQVDVLAPSCEGVSPVPPSCAEKDDNFLGEGSVLAGVARLFSVAVGIIAVIMVVIGGLRFITSSGDPAGVKAARDTLLYAAIGIVIAALAQLLVIFVLDKV